MRRIAISLAALTAILCSAASQAAESRRMTMTHDGIERSIIVDAAPDVRDAPVLIGLHGGLAGASWIRRRAALTLAQRGWVVLWPSAVDEWNDGRVDGNGAPFDDADDVGFLRALVDRLAERGMVDRERVFVAGPSIGGVMALKLLCDAPDFIKGAAVALASLPEGVDCADGPPKPVLYLHGTRDLLMPPGGGAIAGALLLARDRGSVQPVEATLRQLAERNRCDGVEERRLPDRTPDDGSTVLHRVYQGCAAPLEHYVIEGGGHTWPGGRKSRLAEWIVGQTNRDISASRLIEAFLERLAAR